MQARENLVFGSTWNEKSQYKIDKRNEHSFARNPRIASEQYV